MICELCTEKRWREGSLSRTLCGNFHVVLCSAHANAWVEYVTAHPLTGKKTESNAILNALATDHTLTLEKREEKFRVALKRQEEIDRACFSLAAQWMEDNKPAEEVEEVEEVKEEEPDNGQAE